MTQAVATAVRTGQSDVPQGTERAHILTALVEDRPGAVDRVVGVLRRRRAHAQSLTFGPTEAPDIVRVTASVKDSEVAIDHLVEQLRKIVDVRHVENLTAQQAVIRELVLIKVRATATRFGAIIEVAQRFGASVIDASSETIILEAVGNRTKLEELTSALQAHGALEVAHSGCVAMTRDAGA